MTELSKETISDVAKKLIADPVKRIMLDDFVNMNLCQTMDALKSDHFTPSGLISDEEFGKRISAYEAAVRDIQTLAILLARWGDPNQVLTLERIFARLAEVAKRDAGTVVWLRLRWYPIIWLMYAAGIAALSVRRYHALHAIFAAHVRVQETIAPSGEQPILFSAVYAMTEIDDHFKRLPSLERHYVARSEHIFEALRTPVEEALFLGDSYEAIFDRFELFLALAFADIHNPSATGDVWGPFGRFSWKHGHGVGLLDVLIQEATEQGDRWPPLTNGCFGRSPERFLKIATAYKQLLERARWR